MLHKPLTQREAATLYRELKQVIAEDAARRKAATQFSSDYQPGEDGPAKFAGPSTALGDAREQAAAMVPGGASHTTLEKIGYLEHLVADPAQPEPLRAQAAAGLEQIEAGAPVHPIFQAVRDAAIAAQSEREADLHQMADEAVARATAAKKQQTKGRSLTPRPVRLTGVDGEPVRYPVRAFVHTWGELTEWWTHYDPVQLAAELTDEQIAGFLDTAEGTSGFAEELRAACDRRAADDASSARGHLRAL